MNTLIFVLICGLAWLGVWIFTTFVLWRLANRILRAKQLLWKLALIVLCTLFAFVLSLVPVFLVKVYILEPFIVAGNTMEPNYRNGDFLIINKFHRNFDRGDVIVFWHPTNSRYHISRITGLPGESADVRRVTGNGIIGLNTQDYSITLEHDEYSVRADNRNFPYDGIDWEVLTLPAENIVGKILLQDKLKPLNLNSF